MTAVVLAPRRQEYVNLHRHRRQRCSPSTNYGGYGELVGVREHYHISSAVTVKEYSTYVVKIHKTILVRCYVYDHNVWTCTRMTQ